MTVKDSCDSSDSSDSSDSGDSSYISDSCCDSSKFGQCPYEIGLRLLVWC